MLGVSLVLGAALLRTKCNVKLEPGQRTQRADVNEREETHANRSNLKAGLQIIFMRMKEEEKDSRLRSETWNEQTGNKKTLTALRRRFGCLSGRRKLA